MSQEEIGMSLSDLPKAGLHGVVLELIDLIARNGWEARFHEAVAQSRHWNIPEMADIQSLADFVRWINGLLYWVPSENHQGREVYNHLCKFYFVFDQPAVLPLQNKVVPHDQAPPLTELSAWLVRYAKAMGEFLDTPESLTAESLQSFFDSPSYNMNDYVVPHGGWKTFNQFFARNFKPGYRPVAAVADQSVIVSPADSTFAGQWEIRSDSGVTVKNLHWQISELLEGSPYKDRFNNGLFMHAFLGPNDYHRQHAPVGGTVLEARVIPGQVYLEVQAEPIAGDANGSHRLRPVRAFDAPDNAGYQFAQARGLIVLDTAIGLVAVLPIGMCQVSSVIITAEEGVTVRKGEELSYFQFGGSDIILLFEARSNVSFTAQPGVHYKTGTRIAQAFPER
ncbi:phosphatidylserine decarboxylase precursor [Andreprevotia lacus DSM 23236]|jgi:phosphatidylserine decarboxylase|uniref:Phosphatidylserine decarboxylase n=1 Tax=Andreprevotia lacus DSM 23236 TaxID=1121001 RepID=A0A1W1XJ64_9NEIS|nr:phosphatidylserine decarboxylase [Andreprevotia lacus]SMC23867.1 phosphatidylserine decarboxylase precursor [Andreprevotia lacus DSM 23236]